MRERGLNEVAVGAHLLDRALRDLDPELGLDRERDLDQIERVRREIVGERHVGCQLFRPDAQQVRDDAAQPRLQ